MLVVEIFKTIQGEGMLVGTVSVIIRLWGCNLKCKWCDEKISLKPGSGREISIDDLLKRIAIYGCKNVIITGGEPLIHSEIEKLTSSLKKDSYHITVETNATIKKNIICNLLSMSPKLRHSIPDKIKDPEKYNEKRINIDAIRFYIKNYEYQIKFVVGQDKDFDEINEILSKIGDYDKDRVLIMPLASSRNQLFKIQKKVMDMCIKRGIRYSSRLQLQIWGKGKEVK